MSRLPRSSSCTVSSRVRPAGRALASVPSRVRNVLAVQLVRSRVRTADVGGTSGARRSLSAARSGARRSLSAARSSARRSLSAARSGARRSLSAARSSARRSLSAARSGARRSLSAVRSGARRGLRPTRVAARSDGRAAGAPFPAGRRVRAPAGPLPAFRLAARPRPRQPGRSANTVAHFGSASETPVFPV